MLGKLISYDIIQGFHTVRNIYLAALIAAGLMIVGMLADSAGIIALSSMALIIIMMIIVVFTFFAVAAMFNKSLYGNVGYMTLTLPVKEWQIVFSKTLTGVIFILISYLAFLAAFVGVYLFVSGQQGAQVIMQFWQTLEQMGYPSQETLGFYLLFRSILGLVSVLYIVSILHLSVSLVNVSKLDKLGNFGIIIFFFGLVIVLQAIAEKISQLINMSVVLYKNSVFFTFSEDFVTQQKAQGAVSFDIVHYIILLVFSLLACFALTMLIKKKVNVK